ncbi:MAG: hypothetical protein AB1813_20810 [Verrucomicrobiota bacterium]
MDSQRKMIIWTVLGTTLFWGVALLAAFIWFTRPVPGDDVLVDFQREGSVIGMFEVKNPTTNRVFVTLEELLPPRLIPAGSNWFAAICHPTKTSELALKS